MAHIYQNWQVFTNEALMILKNKLVFLKGCNRDNQYLFAKPGMKSGNTINVRLPARFQGRQGEVYQPEAFVQTSVPVVVRPMQGVDIDIPSTEWTLNIENVKRDILAPAMAQLVNNVERDCLQIAYQGVANHVGTVGTAPSSITTPLNAGALLDNLGAPDDDERKLIISPKTNVALVDTMKGFFNPQVKLGGQIDKGMIAKQTLRWDWYQSQNVWQHTVGLLGGSPVVNGANQSGSTLITNGWTATTGKVKKGDIFTIGSGTTGVYAVNPMTRVTFGDLAQFVVLADTTADGSGNMTIPFACHDGRGLTPAPQTFANVDSLPQTTATINVFGSASAQGAQCLGYLRDAFTFAGISQEVPTGSTEQAYEATDPDTGIMLRFIRQYVATQNLFVNRFDVLYAFAVTYPQLAVRMSSN